MRATQPALTATTTNHGDAAAIGLAVDPLAVDPVQWRRLRTAVGRTLESFLGGKRDELTSIEAALGPVVQAVADTAAGGKRLRPAFAYWGWRAVSGPLPEDDAAVLRAAAALELVHTFALVHDDVMDAAATRRGRPATHVAFRHEHETLGLSGRSDLFGTGGAILVGDLALVWADELLHQSGISPAASARVRPIWDAMRTEVIAGQYLDLLRTAGGLPASSGALTVARYKTAGYTVQRPLHLGAALAGAGPAVMDTYTAIALPLGEAFQLRDDVLGVFGDPADTGKSAEEDLREGKQTHLIALTEQATDDRGRALLRHVLGNRQSDTRDLDAVRDLIQDSGALEQVEDRIAAQTSAALKVIAEAAVHDDARAALKALAVAATTRNA